MKVLTMLGLGAALGVAATATASATSGTAATGKQQVVMETRQSSGASSGTFTLTALGEGALTQDSGTFSSAVSQRTVVRSGQSVTIFTTTSTWKGKQGTFQLRERLEGVEAGNGYSVGTGVWSIVPGKGTGDYAGLIGGGREAGVVTGSGRGGRQHLFFFRYDGFVSTH